MFLRRVAMFAVLALSFTCAQAQEFSADLVQSKEGSDAERPPAHVYVGKNKIRMETEREQSGNTGAFIIDGNTNSSIILIPQRKMYIETTPEQNRSGEGFQAFTAFMRPADANNACPQWEAAMAKMKSENKLTSCRKVGNEVVNGRSAVKYQGTSSNGDTGYVWVDPKLRFFLKWESKDGTAELRNIKEGSQPESLFAIPAGYTKFDMGSMMRNRRGSQTPPPQ
jgi:hypothetical protein